MRTLLNMAELNIFYQGTGLVATQRYIAKNRDVFQGENPPGKPQRKGS